MTPNSPTNRSRLLRGGGEGGRRRTGLLGTAFAFALAASLVVFAMPSSADHAVEACTANQQQGKLCLTVSDTPDPVAPSSVGGDSYIAYEATLRNASNSNLTHIGLSDVLPAGTTFFRATSSSGTCSGVGPVNCTIGSLPSGSSATVEVVVTAPTTEGTITNEVTATFDEDSSGGGTGSGGKQATVPYSEPTLVSQTAGETFIPAGLGVVGQIGTDPGQSQHGKTKITDPTTDLLASIDLDAPDNFCVNGTRKIGKKSYVCRDGGFVELAVVHADDPTTHYSNAQDPLVTELRWDGSLTSARQTKKNFVVFYEPDGSTTIQVVSARCDASLSTLPCLRNISPLADGWSLELVNDENGRMR
jgi:uncharacterized repeat protein (TIGR01451 family)